MITKTFIAKHQEFYLEFDSWRKEMQSKNKNPNGVYELVANQKIGRLLKDDENGILYIGQGNILSSNNRVGKFVNSLNNTEKMHDGGNRFNYECIKEKFPLKNLKIMITLSDDSVNLESELLNKYYLDFGELPPFNRRMENNNKLNNPPKKQAL